MYSHTPKPRRSAARAAANLSQHHSSRGHPKKRRSRGVTQKQRLSNIGPRSLLVRKGLQQGHSQKWHCVMRRPSPLVSFEVETWVPLSKLTDEERAAYEEWQKQREPLPHHESASGGGHNHHNTEGDPNIDPKAYQGIFDRPYFKPPPRKVVVVGREMDTVILRSYDMESTLLVDTIPVPVEAPRPPPKRYNHPFEALTPAARQFLQAMNITDPNAFTNSSTSEIAVHYVAFRKKQGLTPLKGSGPGATISAWKTTVRKASWYVIPEEEQQQQKLVAEEAEKKPPAATTTTTTNVPQSAIKDVEMTDAASKATTPSATPAKQQATAPATATSTVTTTTGDSFSTPAPKPASKEEASDPHPTPTPTPAETSSLPNEHSDKTQKVETDPTSEPAKDDDGEKERTETKNHRTESAPQPAAEKSAKEAKATTNESTPIQESLPKKMEESSSSTKPPSETAIPPDNVEMKDASSMPPPPTKVVTDKEVDKNSSTRESVAAKDPVLVSEAAMEKTEDQQAPAVPASTTTKEETPPPAPSSVPAVASSELLSKADDEAATKEVAAPVTTQDPKAENKTPEASTASTEATSETSTKEDRHLDQADMKKMLSRQTSVEASATDALMSLFDTTTTSSSTAAATSPITKATATKRARDETSPSTPLKKRKVFQPQQPPPDESS